MDRARLTAGATWTKDIEAAVDAADVVLAVLTKGSYESDICRAETLRALRKGKRVIPVRGQFGVDVPLHLEAAQYRDLTNARNDASYGPVFEELLHDIHSQASIPLRPQFRSTYVTAPPLPINYVDRTDALESLRGSLIKDGGGRSIALTVLKGMGGIGKTVLAQALCHDEVVQQAFPDGVIWVTVGKEPADSLVNRLREVGKALNDDLERYDTELGCVNQYRTTFRNRAALIVLDDIWRSTDVAPFLAESPRSRLLFTTRDASIAAALGAREHIAGFLNTSECQQVLARWSDVSYEKMPREADAIIAECGRLPLAISMIGATLRAKPPAVWSRVLALIRQSDLESIRVQFPHYPHPSLFRAIQVGMDGLDSATRTRYIALAVLLEDVAVIPAVLRILWNTGYAEVLDTTERLIGLSLAQRVDESGAIRLHDLQLDFVRACSPLRAGLPLIHSAFRLSLSLSLAARIWTPPGCHASNS